MYNVIPTRQVRIRWRVKVIKLTKIELFERLKKYYAMVNKEFSTRLRFTDLIKLYRTLRKFNYLENKRFHKLISTPCRAYPPTPRQPFSSEVIALWVFLRFFPNNSFTLRAKLNYCVRRATIRRWAKIEMLAFIFCFLHHSQTNYINRNFFKQRHNLHTFLWQHRN